MVSVGEGSVKVENHGSWLGHCGWAGEVDTTDYGDKAGDIKGPRHVREQAIFCRRRIPTPLSGITFTSKRPIPQHPTFSRPALSLSSTKMATSTETKIVYLGVSPALPAVSLLLTLLDSPKRTTRPDRAMLRAGAEQLLPFHPREHLRIHNHV